MLRWARSAATQHSSISCLWKKPRHSSACDMSAGSSGAPVGRSKHNGGRDFSQHAYSQHHNMLSLTPSVAFTWASVTLREPHKEWRAALLFENHSDKKKKLKAASRGSKVVVGVDVSRSGDCNRASHFKTILPAVFFLLLWLWLL